MVDIKQLRYFLVLSQQEHMSLTAEILNISQPALSKSIHNLENELGVKLFDRIGNRIQLNQSGKEFAHYAERSLSTLQVGLHSLEQNKYDFQGKIRIVCHVFADGILDCISEYMKLNPCVRIYLFQSKSGDTHLAEGADFLLCSQGELQSIWDKSRIAISLYQEQYHIVISPKYRIYPRDIRSISPLSLKEDWFIGDLIFPDTFGYVDMLTHLGNSFGFIPKIRFYTEDFYSKLTMVKDGHGITILPSSCIRAAKKVCPELQIFSIENFNETRFSCLTRKTDHQLPEVGLDFWSFVQDYYRQMEQEGKEISLK